MKRAILLALALGGCASSATTDEKPAGSGLHSVTVFVGANERLPTTADYVEALSQRAMAEAAAKCGGMKVEVADKAFQARNLLVMNFRCRP